MIICNNCGKQADETIIFGNHTKVDEYGHLCTDCSEELHRQINELIIHEYKLKVIESDILAKP